MKQAKVFFVVLLLSVFSFAQTITIDGDMSDWTAEMQFDLGKYAEGIEDSVDAEGDDGLMDGIINPALDIKDVYVSHDDDYLYVRIDINENGTFTDLQSMVDQGSKALIQIYFDVDLDSTTGLTWGAWLNGGDYYVNVTNAHGNPGLEVTQAYGILHHIGLNGNDESFEEVMGDSCLVAINDDDNKIEVAIPRAAIGETNGEKESTGILVYAEDPTTTNWANDAMPNGLDSTRAVYYYGNPTAIEKHSAVSPEEFSLSQNYPNPFNPTTTIEYSLNRRQVVNISVYNIIGQKIAELYNGVQGVGTHQIVWNGRNSSGSLAPTGIYLYRVKGEKNVKIKKMILAK